ncbi:hypothetical protein M378DRAFT_728338 [Amanita muscaria Koide BX008]|uniref:Uncharacterized protein n=1 Tax=Amanita muscaria (strain Koide BX008) TaxID=946122 RepID=A0A0C2T8Z1_AMAMK|nr:hypothetical protein M378DRAFT_728338 [Amanita muscaria Koide BX008]
MVDHEHDQERSGSTSLGRFPAAEEIHHGFMNTLKDTTHLPVLEAGDDARAGSLSTMDKADSAKSGSGQGSARRDEDKIVAGVAGSTEPVKVLHLTTPNSSRTLQISRSKTANSTA